MGVFARLFPKTAGRKRAAVFVDYEYWYYSFQKMYGLKPDVLQWHKQLTERYTLADTMIFGDFGHKGIGNELPKLRTITNTIIETQNTFSHYKKDMTDFIMLDYIYQMAALDRKVQVFILFTGDGHFQSVVKYLTHRLSREVVLYGVRDSVSKQLKELASECEELPLGDRLSQEYYEMIIENMEYVSNNPSIIPSFRGTVQAVCRKHNAPQPLVETALRELLGRGLLVRKPRRVDFNRDVLVIAPDWEALHNAGLWEYR